VLGSRGATVVSGPELAARLGLTSTWMYFSVKNGARVKREPDHSGRAPAAGAPVTSAPVPPTPQGGAPAPGSPGTAARTGGAAAG
jgi:hypothetical protein